MAGIEEACYVTTVRFDELMGSLQAYVINLKPERKKENNLALKSKIRLIDKKQGEDVVL